MAAHTREQRDFIVRRLAAFYTQEDIVAEFAILWDDTKCDALDVRECDPRFSVIDPDLFQLYTDERARFLENMDAAAPTRDSRVRVVMLHREAERARARGAVTTLQSLLAQIAVETGGAGGSQAPAGGGAVTEIRRVIVRPAE